MNTYDKLYKGAFFLIIILAASPMIIGVLGGLLSVLTGCEPIERADICLILGVNVRHELYNMKYTAWLTLVSIPAGLVGLAVWHVVGRILKKKYDLIS